MRAEFRAASVECGSETRRGNGDLRGERPRVKIDIAQELIFSERIVVVENFDELANQVADCFGLVRDLRQTSRKSGDQKKFVRHFEFGRDRRTQYLEMTQRKRVIQYARGSERDVGAIITHDRN